jgi:hypothetical protein
MCRISGGDRRIAGLAAFQHPSISGGKKKVLRLPTDAE